MKQAIFISLTLIVFAPINSWAETIKVKEGETLSEISETYKIPIKEIMELNNLSNSDKLQIGQKIIISPERNNLDIAEEKIHKVVNGETIDSIANKYGINKQEIIILNRLLNPNKIMIGQTLRIPSTEKDSKSSNKSVHNVLRGETISSIALKYKVRESQILNLNNLRNSDEIYPNQKIKIPNKLLKESNNIKDSEKVKSKTYYIVKQGDTLSMISKSNKISTKELSEINNIKDPNNLSIGDKLYLIKDKDTKKRIGKTKPNSIKKSVWKTYGPLKIDWSKWHKLKENYIVPALNKEGKTLYLAINCDKNLLNATGSKGEWKNWVSPIDKFEHKLLKDLCK